MIFSTISSLILCLQPNIFLNLNLEVIKNKPDTAVLYHDTKMKLRISRFTVHTTIALSMFFMGNAYDDKDFLRGWKNSNVERSLIVQGSEVIYTTNADFDNGTLVNVNHNDVQDQLQLDNSSKPFNFIWVACSGRGTVVKVDTISGAILGEYRTAPTTKIGNPQRTTVDKDGSVWVANWNNVGPHGRGTIVHIGLIENNQCEDSNGSPGIQTSTGLGETSHLGLIRLEIEAYQLHKRVHCPPHRGQ